MGMKFICDGCGLEVEYQNDPEFIGKPEGWKVRGSETKQRLVHACSLECCYKINEDTAEIRPQAGAEDDPIAPLLNQILSGAIDDLQKLDDAQKELENIELYGKKQ